MKTRFIVNPISGTHTKEQVVDLIYKAQERSGRDFEIAYTEGPGHATQLSREVAGRGYEAVVAVGGDGTVHEVGKGLIGSQTALGIIPMGSGNGLATHLGITTDPVQALSVIELMKVVPIDTVNINDDVFFNIAGIGFDAHVSWKFSGLKRRGFWSYLYLILSEFWTYRAREFHLFIDGKPYVEKALLVGFANGSEYGNQFKIAPKAELDDGLLEVAILDYPPLWRTPEFAYRFFSGTAHKLSFYKALRCKEVVIHEKNIRAHLDGEPVEYKEDVHIRINPRSLRVVIP